MVKTSSPRATVIVTFHVPPVDWPAGFSWGLDCPTVCSHAPLGGQERIGLYTTFLADGNLFYYLTIVPEKEAQNYQEAFRRIGESLRLTEVQ